MKRTARFHIKRPRREEVTTMADTLGTVLSQVVSNADGDDNSQVHSHECSPGNSSQVSLTESEVDLVKCYRRSQGHKYTLRPDGFVEVDFSPEYLQKECLRHYEAQLRGPTKVENMAFPVVGKRDDAADDSTTVPFVMSPTTEPETAMADVGIQLTQAAFNSESEEAADVQAVAEVMELDAIEDAELIRNLIDCNKENAFVIRSGGATCVAVSTDPT